MPVMVHLRPDEECPSGNLPPSVVCNNCLGVMLDGGVVPLRGREARKGYVASLDEGRKLVYRPAVMVPLLGRVEPAASDVAAGSPPPPPVKRGPGRPRKVVEAIG